MKSEMFAFIAAVSFFTIGFDSFTFRVWVKMMDSHLIISSFSSHVMILIDNSAAICSSLMAGAWANYFGRKYLLTAMSMLLFVGNLLKGFGMSSYSLLIIGHIASGLGIGLNYTITPIYIAELVPSPFPAQAALVTLLRINAIFSILLIISILIIPESPYWLLMNGNPNNRANEILENSKRNQTEKDHIITAMQQAAAATSNPQHGLLAKLKKGLFLLLNKDFLQPPLRPILFSVCGIVGSFDIALGPVTWVYTAEAFDYMSRTQGSSYAVVCNRIADTIFFLSISHLEGWIKIVLMAGGLVFCTRFVIEKSRQVLK
ncbi:Probable polyol transporter 6 [Linum perenne]